MIQIFSYALALSAAFITYLYTEKELSYDSFIPDHKKIYRVNVERLYSDHEKKLAITPAPIGPLISENINTVSEYVRVLKVNQGFQLSRHHVIDEEANIIFTDTNFFSFFNLQAVHGKLNSCLKKVNQIGISRKLAKKYFGIMNPVGQILETPFGSLLIGAVFEDFPSDSHLKFDIVGNIELTGLDQSRSLLHFSVYTYIKKKGNDSKRSLAKKIDELIQNRLENQLQMQLQLSYQEFSQTGNAYIYSLQSIRSIHLFSDLEHEFEKNNSMLVLGSSLLIGFFILIIGLFNFIHITTSTYFKRMNELAIRKVFGAQFLKIYIQLVFEYLAFATLGFIVSLFIIQLITKHITIIDTTNLVSLGFSSFSYIFKGFVSISIITLILSIYPAYLVATFSPSKFITQQIQFSKRTEKLRRGLVFIQCFFCCFLIILGLQITKQNESLLIKEHHINTEKTYTISKAGFLKAFQNSFMKKLSELDSISNVSSSMFPTLEEEGFKSFFEADFNKRKLVCQTNIVDSSWFNCYELEFIYGNNFSNSKLDSAQVILNKTAWDSLKLSMNTNRNLTTILDDGFRYNFEIKGVVENYLPHKTQNEIPPMVFFHPGSIYGKGKIIHFRSNNFSQSTFAQVDSLWKDIIYEQELSLKSNKEIIHKLYSKEIDLLDNIKLFGLLAFLTTITGILGLLNYNINRKKKSASIYRIIGSPWYKITWFMIKDVCLILLLSIVFAIPFAKLVFSLWQRPYLIEVDFCISCVIFYVILYTVISIIIVYPFIFKNQKQLGIQLLREKG